MLIMKAAFFRFRHLAAWYLWILVRGWNFLGAEYGCHTTVQAQTMSMVTQSMVTIPWCRLRPGEVRNFI